MLCWLAHSSLPLGGELAGPVIAIPMLRLRISSSCTSPRTCRMLLMLLS